VRLAFASDGYLGGRFTFGLDMPFSAPEAELCSLFLYIKQNAHVDPNGRCASSSGDNKSSTKPFSLLFPLVNIALLDFPRDPDLPVPGLAGCSYRKTGRLPFHDAPPRPGRGPYDVVSPSTPKHARTPIRITHDLIIGLTYATGPGEVVRRLAFTKAIELASCEVVSAQAELPTYEAVATGVRRDQGAGVCACHRRVDALPLLDRSDAAEANPQYVKLSDNV
jgi:hypothetical protein